MAFVQRTRHIENLDTVTMRARLVHCSRLQQQLARMQSTSLSPDATTSDSTPSTVSTDLQLATQPPPQATLSSSRSTAVASSIDTHNDAESRSTRASSSSAGSWVKAKTQRAQGNSQGRALSNATLTAAEALVATEMFEDMFTELMCAPELPAERDMHAVHASGEQGKQSADGMTASETTTSGRGSGTYNGNVNFSLDGFEPQRVFTAASHYLARTTPMLAGMSTPLGTERSVLAAVLLPSVEALLLPVLGHREIVNSIASHAILVGARDGAGEECLEGDEGACSYHDSGFGGATSGVGGVGEVANEGVISPRDLEGLQASLQSHSARDRSDVRKTAMHVCRVLATHAANADSLLALCSSCCCMHELPALVDAALDYLIATDPDVLDMRALHTVAHVRGVAETHAQAQSSGSVSTGAVRIDTAAAMAAATNALNFMHVGPLRAADCTTPVSVPAMQQAVGSARKAHAPADTSAAEDTTPRTTAQQYSVSSSGNRECGTCSHTGDAQEASDPDPSTSHMNGNMTEGGSNTIVVPATDVASTVEHPAADTAAGSKVKRISVQDNGAADQNLPESETLPVPHRISKNSTDDAACSHHQPTLALYRQN